MCLNSFDRIYQKTVNIALFYLLINCKYIYLSIHIFEKKLCKYTKNVQTTKKQETKCQFLMKILSFIKNNFVKFGGFFK